MSVFTPGAPGAAAALGKKILAMDLDGTLLKPGAVLSDRAIRAVAACRARGLRLVIVTGRAVASAEKYRAALGAEGPMVYFNGALVAEMPGGRVLHSCLLDAEAAAFCVDLARSRDVYFQAYFPGPRQALVATRDGPEREMYHRHTGILAEVGDLPGELTRAGGIIKGMFLAEPEVQDGFLRPALEERWGAEKRLYVARTYPTFLEVMNAGVSKGRGLQVVLDLLGVSREETAAFGDEENDLPLLAAAGFAVAPANAKEAVKAAADVVTAPNAEDGVAAFLENFCLETRTPPRPPIPFVRNPFYNAPVYHEDRVSSTMDASRDLAQRGAPPGTVVSADFQEAGRGRGRGRGWNMDSGDNLAFTLYLRCPGGVFPEALTLKTGLAVSLALEDVFDTLRGAVQVKWPNDIMVLAPDPAGEGAGGRGRKIAGILTEAEGDRVYIGIGINLGQREFPPAYRDRAVSVLLALEERGALPGAGPAPGEARYGLMERVLFRLWDELGGDPPPAGLSWRSRLEARLYRRGQPARFLPGAADAPGEAVAGTLLGVGPAGELLLETGGRVRSFVTGELDLSGGDGPGGVPREESRGRPGDGLTKNTSERES